MALFAVICTDKPGQLQTRMATRDAHLAYLDATGAVRIGGPLLDDAGDPCGSLLVIDVPDRAAAEAWAAADPYAAAGVFAQTRIEGWRQVI